MLEIEKFIKKYLKNWEDLLSKDPYNIKVSRNKGYVLLKYNQISSDFSYKICRECRGIILDEESNYKIVCKPFDKFFNYGEELAADIDWDSAKIQEKVDGSILKLWWAERLQHFVLSTNGTIFAENTSVMFPSINIKTFHDMFYSVFDGIVEKFPFAKHDDVFKKYTHIFEVVGPENRVVVPYKENDLYYLTSINIDNYSEKKFYEYFGVLSYPKEYHLSSLEDVLEFTKREDFNSFKNEGFVVKDKFNNRIKVKTEDYLRVHRLRGENNPTPKRFLELMRSNEQEEFLSYFPEYREMYDRFVRDYLLNVDQVFKKLDHEFYSMKEKSNSRKEFASYAVKSENPAFLFQMYDEKVKDYKEFLESLSDDKILKLMGHK